MPSAARDPRDPRHTILLMEADPSLRRMIALGLRYRGLDVIEAASPGDLADMSEDISERPPHMIVLDIDGQAGADAEMLTQMQEIPLLASLPAVLLSWDASMPSNRENNVQLRHASLAKPFDARALHAVIEVQLHQANQIPDAREPYAQGAPYSAARVAYSPSAAPSFCPMITAAGLLLTVVGLMLQIAITAIGLLIVIAALLWWTLGTKPENLAVAR